MTLICGFVTSGILRRVFWQVPLSAVLTVTQRPVCINMARAARGPSRRLSHQQIRLLVRLTRICVTSSCSHYGETSWVVYGPCVTVWIPFLSEFWTTCRRIYHYWLDSTLNQSKQKQKKKTRQLQTTTHYNIKRKPDYYTVFTARCTLVQSAVLRSHVVCLSVCPSVTLVNCDHIGWNSSKLISPLFKLGCSLFATPTWRICSKGNTLKFGPKVTHPQLIWASETFDRKLRLNGYR